MTDFVVVTSIFEPTESIKKLAQNKDNHIIVVGDKKSPKEYELNSKNAKITFLPYDKPLGLKIEKVLPYNHYCRKMLGYIYAKNSGAEIIYETDDDNYPKSNFESLKFDREEYFLPENRGFINVYKYYTKDDIWPRGFPLDLITDKNTFPKDSELEKKDLKIGVYQGLVDNEPDVDAIYRLTDNKRCNFENKKPIALSKGTICPYNSQNTFTRKELFPLLYLPCTVTFRFTDILRGLIAQPLMWNEGYYLCFTSSSAIQERNVHNYMKDFESEIPVYLYCKKVVDIASESIKKELSLKDNLYNVYLSLLKENIVKDEEIPILEGFLNDI